jgi:3-hydroxyisobutyrate dehydrogenase
MSAIGFIGLGIMGESMCENIVKKSGEDVYAYDVDSAKIRQLAALGARPAASIAEVATMADIIFIMVPKSEHVKQVVTELLKNIRPQTIIADMSTISPKVSVELAKAVKKKGGIMLDAPVVKSKPAAIAGQLGIYVGGDKETYEKIRPLLACMGSNIIHMGNNGTGLIMKLCHNMLVGGIQNSVNEMIVLAEKAKLDFNDVVTAISYGGGQCFYLDAKAKSLGANNFAPAFPFEHMDKDMNLAAGLARELGISLKGLKNICQVYKAGMEKKLNREDFSASIKMVRKAAKAPRK